MVFSIFRERVFLYFNFLNFFDRQKKKKAREYIFILAQLAMCKIYKYK